MFNRFVRPLLLAFAMLLCVPAAASARVVIVATDTSNAVLIDTRTNAVVGSVALPGKTRAVAAAPDGTRGYLAAGATVSIIDLAARRGAGSATLPGTPLALAVTADGTQIWAARKGALDLVDIATARRIGERKLAGTPVDMAITDDRAVVVQAGGKVAILDLGTGRLIRRVNIAGAAGVSIDSDGRAWVSATTPRKGRRGPASRIVRLSLATGALTSSVPLGTDGGGGLGVSPDGGRAIVAPGAKLRGVHRKAALVDLAKRRVLRRPPTGGGPGRAIWSPDGARLYVSDAGRKTVSVLAAATGTRLRTLTVAGRPGGLVVSPASPC